MKNTIEKLKNTLREEILNLRKMRLSGFMYLPKNLGLNVLATLFLNEYLGQTETADKILINETLHDLIKRKILHEGNITFHKNKISEGTFYYDLYLRTFDNGVYSRGTSTDMATAYAKAIGEVFERTSLKYPSSAIEEIEFSNKTVREMRGDKNFIDFNILPKPVKEQLEKFSNFRVEETDSFEFVKVKSLFSEAADGPSEIFVPRQAIFFGYKKNREKEILQPTTHGAGAGHTFEQAFNSAFFEALHRHFFLKSWYHKQSPNLLNLNSLDVKSKLWQKINKLEAKGFKINILDYREEAEVPTFICLLEKFGGLYCGGSSNFDQYHAIERSIDEAMSIYYWEVGKFLTDGNNLNQQAIDGLKDQFLDTSLDAKIRVQVFANSYYVKKLDKFFLAGRSVSIDDYVFDQVNFDLKKYALKTFGKDFYYYEAKNNYLEDYNFHTIKIYIPNSYYFPLSEIYARPILADGIEPKYTDVNPFP